MEPTLYENLSLSENFSGTKKKAKIMENYM
jgi:hypothetical protein